MIVKYFPGKKNIQQSRFSYWKSYTCGKYNIFIFKEVKTIKQ